MPDSNVLSPTYDASEDGFDDSTDMHEKLQENKDGKLFKNQVKKNEVPKKSTK